MTTTTTKMMTDIIFVICIRILKMNTFFGFYSNTLEYCQSNQHESDRNDVSPRDFLKLASE